MSETEVAGTGVGAEAGAKAGFGEEVQETPRGVISTTGRRTNVDVPERIIKKLARIAGLDYRDGHPREAGGLCLGIYGSKPRRKALMILGLMVGQIGRESTHAAIERAGGAWLDVVGWREDPEYAALWAAAVKVRREVAASMLEDDLWDRSLNGYDSEEVRGGARVTLRKFDNNLGVNLLKGLGFVGKDAGVRPVRGKKKVGEKGVPGVDGEAEGIGENVDTVLFADRATAFAAMGKADPLGRGEKGQG